MNNNCLVECKMKDCCKLSAVNTEKCLYAKESARLDDGTIFGRDSAEINRMQGREGKLK